MIFLGFNIPKLSAGICVLFSFLLFMTLLFSCGCGETSRPRQCIDRRFFRLTPQRDKAPSWQEAGLAARLGNRNHIFPLKVERSLDFRWGFKSSKSIPRDIHPSSRWYLLNLPEEWHPVGIKYSNLWAYVVQFSFTLLQWLKEYTLCQCHILLECYFNATHFHVEQVFLFSSGRHANIYVSCDKSKFVCPNSKKTILSVFFSNLFHGKFKRIISIIKKSNMKLGRGGIHL